MNLVKFQFNKLIRDKIPERMVTQGIKINSSPLNEEEYILKLKEKLLEEANEVAATKELDDLKIELADVLEVLHAIAAACKIDYKDIEQARIKKNKINGEFTPDNYINYIEVEEHNTKVIDYQKDKNRHYKLEL